MTFTFTFNAAAAKSLQSCPTLCNPIDRSPPDSPIPGILQARILEWVAKESTCSAGDPGLIPGLGRFTGEGIGYPLQYSWASLVAQLLKAPPAMWETWVWFLGMGRSPGEGKGYPLQYSGLMKSMNCFTGLQRIRHS